MGNLEELLSLSRIEGCRKMKCQLDRADSVRVFGHGPLHIDREPVDRKPMTHAVPAHKISHAAREGADEQLDGSHSGVGAAILDRLINRNGMGPALNFETDSPQGFHGEVHAASNRWSGLARRRAGVEPQQLPGWTEANGTRYQRDPTDEVGGAGCPSWQVAQGPDHE